MIYVLVVVLSILVIGLAYVSYRAIKSLVEAAEQVAYIGYVYDDMLEAFEYFKDHVESVNNMEMYYGDEVLQSLLDHSRDIVKDIKEFGKLFEKDLDGSPVLVIREELGELDGEEEKEE